MEFSRIEASLFISIKLFSRLLPIDRARSREKGQPFCMEQYYRLFTSYRYPGIEKDNLVTSYGGGGTNDFAEPEHIIVVCKNQVSIK